MLKNYLYRGIACALFAVAASQVVAVDDARQQLTADSLFSANEIKQPVSMGAFAFTDNTSAPKNQFQGRLVFTEDNHRSSIRVFRDDYNFSSRKEREITQLPAFDFEFVQSGQYLIPVQRGAIKNSHPHWEYILEPGRVWQEAGDKGYSRAAIPFSLQERNANCTHNGVMSFLFKTDGSISKLAYQVVSETCLYFKFDLWGLFEAKYMPSTVDDAWQVIANHQQEIANRLPVKSIAQLAVDYPVVNLKQFGGVDLIKPGDMTVFGFVIDGTNYVGGCETRYGSYPYCEVLDIPSYSLAKSIFAGMGLMYLEKKYPGTKALKIADYVPACKASGRWADVSFEQTLNMTTGNYQSAKDRIDEWSKEKDVQFFIPETHTEKIDYACNTMLRQSVPGTKWVYHTSDTYILGTAMNNFIKKKMNKHADSFSDIFIELWQPLQLSPVTATTVRSYDDFSQALTGFGLTLHHDDIARMAVAINDQQSYLNGLLDKPMLEAALQRNPADRGLPAANTGFRYKNGFWAYNAQPFLACKTATWLPFMTGYGGINVVMMPNDTVYYYFSDSGKFSWREAAKASNSIRAFCE